MLMGQGPHDSSVDTLGAGAMYIHVVMVAAHCVQTVCSRLHRVFFVGYRGHGAAPPVVVVLLLGAREHSV